MRGGSDSGGDRGREREVKFDEGWMGRQNWTSANKILAFLTIFLSNL